MPAKRTAAPAPQLPSPLELFEAKVIACERCPRLRTYCAAIAREKRRAYREETYWGRPVPSFGDPEARVLLLGLAPGAHGSPATAPATSSTRFCGRQASLHSPTQPRARTA
jgi:hypothetical protein